MAGSTSQSQTNTSSGSQIAQSIEQDAGLYPPSIYQVLTFCSSLQQQNDPQAQNYTPYTSALRGMSTLTSQANYLPFVIGLIPPAAPPGQVLDRTATAVATTTLANFLPPPLPPGVNGIGSVNSGVGTGGGTSGTYPYAAGPTTAPPGSDFYTQFVAMCNRLNVDPTQMAAVLYAESGLRPEAQAWRTSSGAPCKVGDTSNGGHLVAAGLNQMTHATATGLGMPESVWQQYPTLTNTQQLFWVEKYMSQVGVAQQDAQTIYGKNFGGYNSSNPTAPDGSTIAYASQAYMDANGGPSAWPNYQANITAYQSNRGLDPNSQGYLTSANLGAALQRNALPSSEIANIQAGMANLGMTPGALSASTPPTVPSPPSPAWNATGAPASQASAQQQASLAGTALSIQQSTINTGLMAAQQTQINATNAAIKQMASTPPLQMLVSPTSFKFSAEKVVADGSWSRNGPIIEHWGNQQEKIEGSGKLAAFYALDNSPPTNNPNVTNDGPGLTRMARSFSMSYQNFLSLYLLYKNNGGIWLDPTASQKNKTTTGITQLNLSMLGSVYLYYDTTLYVGSFDNFTITETADAPFTLEYSFSFTVRAWFLLDQPPNLTPAFGVGGGIPTTVSPENKVVGSAVTATQNATKGFL